jgi:hypothetical protein
VHIFESPTPLTSQISRTLQLDIGIFENLPFRISDDVKAVIEADD